MRLRADANCSPASSRYVAARNSARLAIESDLARAATRLASNLPGGISCAIESAVALATRATALSESTGRVVETWSQMACFAAETESYGMALTAFAVTLTVR